MSPWGSPVLFVKKMDGSLQLCVDFRALSKATKKDRYPLPLISDLLTTPALARIYTKINLKHASHLVCIAEGDELKTAFCTQYGLNAPASFQRFINEVLGELMDVCIVGYLDDILIYLDLLENHGDNICGVLQHLWKAGLYANLKKCKFHTDTMEYLGFILLPNGLQMDPSKESAIMKWLEPQKVKDVQAFLGFANFYNRFIHGYTEITLTLTMICNTNTP